MKKILLLVLLPVFFVACKKDSDTSAATGSISYVNQSNDVYNIYLEGGNYGQVQPNSFKVVSNIPVDSHVVKAVQANNYTQKPITKENTIRVVKNDTTFFTFP